MLDDHRIGWLERGEARREPFAWPEFGPQRLLHARAFRPDPQSSFQVALGYAEGTNWQTEGGWYCLAWLGPLVQLESMSTCTRDDAVRVVLSYMGAWPSSVQQLPLGVGMAADEVKTLELHYAGGSRRKIYRQQRLRLPHAQERARQAGRPRRGTARRQSRRRRRTRQRHQWDRGRAVISRRVSPSASRHGLEDRRPAHGDSPAAPRR